MTRICWATHVLHRLKQRVAKINIEANLKKQSKFGLFPETRKYEVGIVSNRMIV